MMTKTRHRLISALAIVAALGACTKPGTSIPTAAEFSRLADTPIKDRSADARRSMSDAVNFFAEPPVTLLETGVSHALELTMKQSQRVPNVTVGDINASPMPFSNLLEQISRQIGMNWRITGKNKSELMNKEIYLVQRNETSLARILEELSEQTDAFYRIEGDRIVFSQDELFVLRVPRMKDSQEVLVEGLGNLGATEIFADKLSGTISFRATKPVYANAKQLMTSFEKGRDMVVYDVWVIERNFDDRGGLGAKIGVTNTDSGATMGTDGSTLIRAIASGTTGGMLTGNLGKVDVDMTVDFLRSLGETETVARPTISMLSGGESSFKSGTSREYIRGISSENNDDGGSSTSGTDVEKLETGINVIVEGSHNNGVISTDFDIEVDEFVGFEEFDTGEVTLKLPHTTERKLKAHLEARPGDVMVLGGIIHDREDRTSQEIGDTTLPVARARESRKLETIILVRPRLVQIRPTQSAAPPRTLEIDSRIGDMSFLDEDIFAMDEPARAAAVPSADDEVSRLIEDEAKIRDLLLEMKG